MAAPTQSPLRRVLSVPAEIVVGLYVVVDAIIAPLFGPIVRFLSRLRLIQRLERAIGSLPPYVILVALVVPFGIAEVTKVLGVFLMSEGHFRFGMTIFIGAYVVSILVCERTFHAGKAQLMTIPWFAVTYNWIMAIRDHILDWFKETRIWRMAEATRQRARIVLRRLRTRLRMSFGARPRGSFERR